MSKHDVRDYVAILVLLSVMIFAMQAFTKFVDRHADKYYADQFKKGKYGQTNKR